MVSVKPGGIKYHFIYISCRVIPKTQKMVLDATWFNTQHCKVSIKGKVGQPRK